MAKTKPELRFPLRMQTVLRLSRTDNVTCAGAQPQQFKLNLTFLLGTILESEHRER